MPYITSVERVGYKRGFQEGEQRGILKAIGLGLELKFGKSGLHLMKKISEIRDMKTLDAIYEGLRKVSEIKELREIYERKSAT